MPYFESVDGLQINTETGSTAATLSAGLTSIISSTAAQAYALPQPAPGLMKTIVKTSSSTAVQTVSATLSGSTSTIGATGVTLTFSAVDQAVILMGVGANRWEIVSNVGSVTVS